MFCESCGKNIPDESRFCEYCGSEVIPESVIYSQEDIDNNIHSEQESASYNKQKRGLRYDQEIEKEYEYPRTPKPKKSGLIKKAAAFLVLAVVLVGGYSLLRQFIGKNPERIVENSIAAIPAIKFAVTNKFFSHILPHYNIFFYPSIIVGVIPVSKRNLLIISFIASGSISGRTIRRFCICFSLP
jgi:hypothetical protein